jgi:predicted dehydrogenase
MTAPLYPFVRRPAMQRRHFLENSLSAAGLSALASTTVLGDDQPEQARVAANDKIAICMVGMRGRGGTVLSTFASIPEVEVKYVCDIDEGVLKAKVEAIEKQTGRKPQAIKDYRQAIDDKTVDALVIGTPDHWHALPTIHACLADKDVYVEKPDGHNILEGRTMVAAAKKHNRVVQLGTQSRSGPHFLALVEYLKTGVLGTVRFAKAWESAKQGSIGHTADSEPPAGVDYDRWLGPAPKRAFNARRFHGSWRWFFDYGTGDLGNDGVHRLDYARWFLAAAAEGKGETVPLLPRAVSAIGGKVYFDDDQEWPDNLIVSYDLGGKFVLTYEMRIWTPYPMHDAGEGCVVLGDEGYVVVDNGRWRHFDPKGKVVKEMAGGYAEVGHAQGFLDCMRSRKKPTADLETVGHPSSLLCHIGNAAWRTGRTLRYDDQAGKFTGDADADQFLTRAEYRKGYELPKV